MTDKYIAIRIRGLGKKYTLGGQQEKYITIRNAIADLVMTPFVCTDERWHAIEIKYFRVSDVHVR